MAVTSCQHINNVIQLWKCISKAVRYSASFSLLNISLNLFKLQSVNLALGKIVPGSLGDLADGRTLTIEMFYEIIKAVVRQCSSSLCRNGVWQLTSQNRCFYHLQMFLFGGTKILLFMKWSVKKLVPPCGGCGNVSHKLISHFGGELVLNSRLSLQFDSDQSFDFIL